MPSSRPCLANLNATRILNTVSRLTAASKDGRRHKTVLLDNEYVTLSLDESVPCVEWIGKKYMPAEEFRASEEKSLEFFLAYKGRYPRLEYFVDARNIGPISPQDTKWIVDELFPRFLAAHLKKEAFVVPASAVGRMVVKNYKSKVNEMIEIKEFDSAEAAKDWLRG